MSAENYIFSESNRVGVVVATHEKCLTLSQCLHSFSNSLSNPLDVIFVDNGSEENLQKWAKEQFPAITSIRLPQNRLFCGGYNAGIRIAVERGYDFVLIVNADTEVINPGFVAELVKTARRWPRAAFIGPLVYLRSQDVVQKTCLQFPGILRNAAIWLPWRFFPQYFEAQPNKETAVEFLNGICVLCRVEALRELGPMDENMGGYVEDADWAWRAQKKGWVSVFTPVPSVIHHEEAIGYEPYSLKTFLLKRNTVLWFLKIGKEASATIYARLSIALAWIRMKMERSEREKEKHKLFIRRLGRSYKGLLSGEELGEWFGPPLTNWRSF